MSQFMRDREPSARKRIAPVDEDRRTASRGDESTRLLQIGWHNLHDESGRDGVGINWDRSGHTGRREQLARYRLSGPY